MLDMWNLMSVRLCDVLLGWLLLLPRSIAVVVVGLLTAGLLTLIRCWTTNQDRLRRAAADMRRLKESKRAAKQTHDVEALARLNMTMSRVSLLKLKAEGWPTLAVIVPVILLMTWAFERLEFYPPTADDEVVVVAHLRSGRDPALTARDDLLHLVPQPGLRAKNGWVQSVHIDAEPPSWWDRFWSKVTFRKVKDPDQDAYALWQLEGDARREPYPLAFRWNERTIERELLIGQPHYSPPREERPDDSVITEVRLREVRLFGIPGLGPWLPAWLVGYLLVTIPFVFALKRVLGIY
jgi:hypothetical protein